jgi:hypothetical protein
MVTIKMVLGEIRLGGIFWIDLAQDRDQQRDLVNKVINLWVRLTHNGQHCAISQKKAQFSLNFQTKFLSSL